MPSSLSSNLKGVDHKKMKEIREKIKIYSINKLYYINKQAGISVIVVQ